VEAQHPFRGLGTVEDVARAALFLVSEDASWVTGIGLPVDGGFTSGSHL
jgi:NAD(P)-dependent dehydrogenase (short-subunit alcohol dehydrogenase family)